MVAKKLTNKQRNELLKLAAENENLADLLGLEKWAGFWLGVRLTLETEADILIDSAKTDLEDLRKKVEDTDRHERDFPSGWGDINF